MVVVTQDQSTAQPKASLDLEVQTVGWVEGELNKVG